MMRLMMVILMMNKKGMRPGPRQEQEQPGGHGESLQAHKKGGVLWYFDHLVRKCERNNESLHVEKESCMGLGEGGREGEEEEMSGEEKEREKRKRACVANGEGLEFEGQCLKLVLQY